MKDYIGILRHKSKMFESAQEHKVRLRISSLARDQKLAEKKNVFVIQSFQGLKLK